MGRLTELFRQRNERESDLAAWRRLDQRMTQRLTDRVSDIARAIGESRSGLDDLAIKRAEGLFRFQGDPRTDKRGAFSNQRSDFHVRYRAVQDAIYLLAENPEWFQRKYIGVKNYAHFGDQREDHEHGLGPKHGSIVFSIRQLDRAHELTPDQIEDVIYYLANWCEIIEARVTA